MALTYKQRLFITYYLGVSNGNGEDAARRAGYQGSHSTVSALACRLQQNTAIRAAIDARLDAAAMSADEVLARMSDIASGTLDDFVDVTKPGGYKLNLKKAKRVDKLHLIRKLKTTLQGEEIELHDPRRALEKLGEYHGLWTREQVAGLNAEQLAERLRERRAQLGDRGTD